MMMRMRISYQHQIGYGFVNRTPLPSLGRNSNEFSIIIAAANASPSKGGFPKAGVASSSSHVVVVIVGGTAHSPNRIL